MSNNNKSYSEVIFNPHGQLTGLANPPIWLLKCSCLQSYLVISVHTSHWATGPHSSLACRQKSGAGDFHSVFHTWSWSSQDTIVTLHSGQQYKVKIRNLEHNLIAGPYKSFGSETQV